MPPAFDLQAWAVPQLQKLIPLPDEDCRAAIAYAISLPSSTAVLTHFKDFLGESSDSLNFIAEFNRHRFPQKSSPPKPADANPPLPTSAAIVAASEPSFGVSKTKAQKKKKKNDIANYKQAPRRANEGTGFDVAATGGYLKGDIEDEYYTGGSRKSTPKPPEDTPKAPPPEPKPAPKKDAGTLTSDFGSKAKKKPQKIAYTGGTSMRGQSAELDALDASLRALESSTNPTLTSKRRRCKCQAAEHGVLEAAPNCLACGKIICEKEGLGPCTFCGTPLLSAETVQEMVRSLREERGREKMALDAALHKKPEVVSTRKAYSGAVTPASGGSRPDTPAAGPASDNEELRKAKETRDKLLGWQATSAQRTKIIDQAADFDAPSSGVNQWATPSERAVQLKKQQKRLREMEWDAKPEYEKRNVVVSIDLKGRRVTRKMVEKEMESSESEDEEVYYEEVDGEQQGTYSRNPLVRGLIRPVWKGEEASGKGKGKEKRKEAVREEGLHGWRRAQDNMEDNEELILGAGSFGVERGERGNEPACG